MKEIAKLILAELGEVLLNKHIRFEASDALLTMIAEKGFDRQYGARPLRRIVQNRVEDILADAIVKKTVQADDFLLIDYNKENDKVLISKKELKKPSKNSTEAFREKTSEPKAKDKKSHQSGKKVKKKKLEQDQQERLPASL